MNQIAKLSDLKGALANYKQEAPVGMLGTLLRMGTDGIWIYGQENVEVQDGSRWAINPFSICHGWACWTNHPKGGPANSMVGEVMVPISQKTVAEADLPDKKWPWKRQVSFDVVCINGEDKGLQVLYKNTSRGALNALDELVKAISSQVDGGSDVVAVVELQNDSYKHKQYGKTYIPVFKIAGWASMDDQSFDDAASEETDETLEQPLAEDEYMDADGNVLKKSEPETVANTPQVSVAATETVAPTVRRRRRRPAA